VQKELVESLEAYRLAAAAVAALDEAEALSVLKVYIDMCIYRWIDT